MAGERPSSYANQLLNVAREYHLVACPPAVAMAQRNSLEQRVRALLDQARSHLPVSPRAACGLLLGSLVACTLLAAVKLEAVTQPPLQLPAEQAKQAVKQDSTLGSGIAEDAAAPLKFEGSVLDPQGNPVAGAKLYFVHWISEALPNGELGPVGVTDAQGRFSFEANRADYEGVDGEAWRYMPLFAAKEGFGVAGKFFETTGAAQSIRLVNDEQHVEGRVLTVDGQPVPGARIRVKELWFSSTEFLDRWEDATLHSQADYYSLRNQMDNLVNGPQLPSLVPDVFSDAQGNFVMRGIGRERIVELLISGPTIETAIVKARTRDGKIVKVPHQAGKIGQGMPDETYHPRTFSYVAAPSVPIEGRMTDKATGKPIAHVRVSAGVRGTFMRGGKDYIGTFTDADGHYRIEGLSVDGTDSLYFVPPNGSPYLPQQIRPKFQGRETLTQDLALKATPMITGQAVDSRTGKPVLGMVQYFAMRDNPQLADFGAFASSVHHESRTDKDGNYAIAAVPGDGFITFMALDHTKYSRAGASPAIGTRLGSPADARGIYDTVPQMLMASSVHFVEKVTVPAEGDLRVSIELNSGETLNGQVLDENGKPATKVIYKGHVSPGSWMPLSDETFVVDGYYASKPRELFFYQAATNAAAYLRLAGAAPETLLVQLKPAATIRGRLLDAAGAPILDAQLRGEHIIANTLGDPDLIIATDEEGRFEIRGIIPGHPYTIHAFHPTVSFEAPLFQDLVVEAAEIKDLGDIQVGEQK